MGLVLALVAPGLALAQTASPGFVYAEAVRGHNVVVNWEPTTTGGTINYFIYRGTGSTEPSWPSGYSKVGTVTGQAMQSYVDNDAKATSTRYWYVVTAKSSTDTESNQSPTGNGLTSRYQPLATSNAYRFYIGPTTGPPVEPMGLELSGADGTITVDWDAVPSTNVDYYNVYRAEQSGVDGTLVAQVSAPTTVYNDTGVEKYKHYYYRISAVDDQSAEGYKSIEHHYRTVSSADIDAPHGGSAVTTLTPGQDTCGMCHSIHVADAPKLLVADDALGEPALCLSCHDGTGSRYDVRREFTDISNSSHEVTITAADDSVVVAGLYDCVDCHTPHGDPQAVGSKKLLYSNDATEGNDVCYGSECHGSASSDHWAGDMSDFDDSVHNSEIPEPASGTKVKCSTCHMPHASPNESLNVMTSYRNCLDCHSSEHVELDTPDIYTRMTMNQDTESHHDVLERDQDANGTFISCQNCHNTHVVSEDYPLVDPDDPSMDGVWTESRTTSLAIQNGAATDPKYNGFCLACHDGTLPTSTDTSPWAEAPDDNGLLVENILSRWTNDNSHGAVVSKDPQLLGGYAKADTLSCLTCHESHGTINNSNLRCDVPAKDGTKLSTARLLVPRLDGSGNETGDYDTRFFCMSCHQKTATNPTSHFSTNTNQPKTFYYFPTTCTASACHTHGSTGRRF